MCKNEFITKIINIVATYQKLWDESYETTTLIKILLWFRQELTKNYM